jgi:peptidoglycan/xylan/chitin deacetylase (PgdA/CDA1 family)
MYGEFLVYALHDIQFHNQSLLSEDPYSINSIKFENFVNYLLRYKVTFTTFSLLNKNFNNKKNVILTFDDGIENHFLVSRVLDKLGIKGVFFINPFYLNKDGFIKKEQILEMVNNGHEIGSHSFTHVNLKKLDKKSLYDELKKSKNLIENIIQQDVISFAPPYGFYNEIVISISKKVGYKYFCTTEWGLNDTLKEFLICKRMTLKNGIPFNFYYPYKRIVSFSINFSKKIKELIF